MPRKTLFFAPKLALAVIASITLSSSTLVAQTEKIIHEFPGAHDGGHGNGYPNGGLIVDSAGNLYGTTGTIGSPCSNCGSVFELSPITGGGYTQTLLHTFSGVGNSPVNPLAGLVMDASGNLYGTSYDGGSEGDGTVFALSNSGGVWTEAVLHNFGRVSTDATHPATGLVIDAAGNLYGTTQTGGQYGLGTVYELSPVTGGWEYRVLHSFKSSDGADPGQLVIDGAGNLYATTYSGGKYGSGEFFELSPTTGGGWTFAIPYYFDNIVGPGPYLTVDSAGNFYGMLKGAVGHGSAFELSPAGGGTWTEQTLIEFCGTTCPVGAGPAALVVDGSGNLYGTMYTGGAHSGGTVFELSPVVGGSWSETLLHSFGGGSDGTSPQGSLLYTGGAVYGATYLGGESGYGTIYQITP
ncbi:MAG TPA: choice-of-anchor tandem repeat GloVer-containing protein [Candidatus Aquilonibacter sp.]|jgi:uncharacterized repeat protein (TIGR03803 family)|nr:choice-of-anchor tandem repeat GloVer-containing protein [Candidatus Aquilonibacter sp.]